MRSDGSRQGSALPAVAPLQPRRRGLEGGTLAAATGAAIVLPAAAVAALQYLSVPPWLMAVAAGLGAAAPLVTAEARMRTRTRHELRRVLAAHVRGWQRGPGDRGGLPLTGTIDDLTWLGVKPAARIDGNRVESRVPGNGRS